MRTVALLSLCLFTGSVAAQQAAPKPAAPPRPVGPVWDLFPPGHQPALAFPEELPSFDFHEFDLHEFDFEFDFHWPDVEWHAFELPDFAMPEVWVAPGHEYVAAPMGEPWGLAPLPGRADRAPLARGELKYLPEPTGQETAEDSLYRQARETLNRGEYQRAAELFRTFEQRYTASRYVPAAVYWQAFARYRIGADRELRTTLELLERLRTQHPQAAQETDVQALYTRVAGTLAARGDETLAARLRASGQQQAVCDKDEMSVKAEALNALYQADRAAALDVIRRTLSRRDECSVALRRRAVYLLGREDGPAVTGELAGVARNDPNASVRSDAISQLGRRDPEQASRVLQELFNAAEDDRSQRSILGSMARLESESGRQFIRRQIEREDLSEAVRADAIRTLYGRMISSQIAVTRQATGVTRALVAPTTRPSGNLEESDAAYLRALYGRSTSRTIKTAILETLSRAGGQANDAWLMGIVRSGSEEMRYRSSALSRLRRSDVPIAEVVSLYDAVTERQLRTSIISVLRQREEDAAADKLIDIARRGTDPDLRRAALSALTQKKDPRTRALLLEILEP